MLDAVEAVLRCAATMTWKGLHPVVELVTTPSPSGVKRTAEEMRPVEAQLTRLPR